MTDKKEALEMWKLMICAKTYIEPDVSLPETNWIVVLWEKEGLKMEEQPYSLGTFL